MSTLLGLARGLGWTLAIRPRGESATVIRRRLGALPGQADAPLQAEDGTSRRAATDLGAGVSQ